VTLPSPSKELGQHFLVDDNILGVIGRLADLQPEDVVLEIGPGPGGLTAYLSDRVARVHAVELDRRLQLYLQTRFENSVNVELRFADAVTLDPAELDPPPTKLVSNLPYNVGAHRLPPCLAVGLQAAAQRRLGARCLPPSFQPATDSLAGAEASRGGRVRPSTQAAAELAGARGPN
jgi:hypothetical protein